MALLGLVYRDRLFPREAYRRDLRRPPGRRLPERQACRTMVELLALAHDRGCEAELAECLADDLDAGRLPDIAGPARPASRPIPASVPHVTVELALPGELREPARLHRDGRGRMTAAAPIDAARLGLMLNELRLPTIKTVWPDFAARADKEGWPAARFLAAHGRA